MPPRSLRSCVYVTEPTGLSTLLSARRWSKLSAPAPDTSSLLKEVSSKRQEPSRVARCSASIAVDQCGDEEAPDVRCRAQDELAVVRERLRAVDQRDDLGAPDGRHA